MKPALAMLTLLGLLLLGERLGLHGQIFFDSGPRRFTLKGESDATDPFDLKNRRTLTVSEADLELLKKYALDASTESLVAYVRKRTLADADRAKVAALVEQLGAPAFRAREKATDDILKLGPAVLEFLRKGAKVNGLEVARRAEACAERLRSAEPPSEVSAAAVRLLASRQPSELVTVLLAYLPYVGSESIADEVNAALRQSSRVDGQPHPELVAALTDALAVRRAAAAEALVGLKEHAAAVKNLLRDPEPFVRVRVARSLILANDKSAVPTLIDALPRVSTAQAWTGEDVLLRLAEGRNPPTLPRSGNEAARKKYADAWLAWWAKNEAQIDLVKLHEVPNLLGHTVVVLLDLGCILELNAKNETIWQIAHLAKPLDVQVLANGNVLVAEYAASRVTERDPFRGSIKWEKDVDGPLVAQRLPNRNTFVATESQLLEFDENGDEVMSFSMPAGERVMKACKIPNGEIVAVTSEARVVRMNNKGMELGSFPINYTRLSGGRIHVLPNGRVLVPHFAENKVVEYDSQGRIVWELTVPEPVAAMRLPNGNTLVTTFQEQTGAMEFDHTGHETEWNFRHPQLASKVTRALRR